MVSLVVSLVSAEDTPKQDSNTKHVKSCTKNLQEIGKAIQTYKDEHGEFPDRLSDTNVNENCSLK